MKKGKNKKSIISFLHLSRFLSHVHLSFSHFCYLTLRYEPCCSDLEDTDGNLHKRCGLSRILSLNKTSTPYHSRAGENPVTGYRAWYVFSLNKKGMTLVELLVSMGIFAVVITMVVSFFISLQKLQIVYRDRANLQQEGRIASEIISRYVREAQSITFSNNNNLCTTGGPLTATMLDGTSLTFTCNNGSLKMNSSNITSNNVYVSDITFYRSSEATYPKTLRYKIEVRQLKDDGSMSSDPGDIITFPGYLVMRNEL